MSKDTKETLIAIFILIAAAAMGFTFGAQVVMQHNAKEYERGLSEGVTINKGDKWDCAYSSVTGFLMCDRTPKYKDKP